MRDKVNGLVRLTIKQQILEAVGVEKDYPEYRNIIDLHIAISQILLPIEESLIISAKRYFTKEKIEEIRKKVLFTKKPVTSFLNIELSNEMTTSDLIKNIIRSILKREKGGEDLGRLLTAIEQKEMNVIDGVIAAQREDFSWFENIGKKYGLDNASLIYIFSKPSQPFYEEMARIFEGEFGEIWKEQFCPVCGRLPVIARVRDRKRYMSCTYCGTEYQVDQFICQHCGNGDPNSLGFVSIEGDKGYEIEYCEKCRHYIKVLYNNKTKKSIPSGLEDILTQHLDTIAKDQNIGL